MQISFLSMAGACLVALGLSGCGGGSATTGSNTVSLSGQAVKGPVSGGQVCAYTTAAVRKLIVCTTTDANSNYTLNLPADTGEVLLEVTGGSYTDEATGLVVALTSPLRALSKGGGALSNVLMTPFTELAVQKAVQANPSGNLTVLSFQTQVGVLETALGFTGIANGKPFGGTSGNDTAYLKALTAFAKQQSSTGQTVGATLQSMSTTLDQCGAASLGANLAVYATAAKQASAPVATPTAAAFEVTSSTLVVDDVLPTPCSNRLTIDGQSASFADLSLSTPPTSWANAKSVEITACASVTQGKWFFPLADVLIHGHLAAPTMNVVTTGNFSLPGAKAIDLAQSQLSILPNGCLAITRL